MLAPKTRVLLFILFISTGHALKCHTCNSLTDPGCNNVKFEPLNKTNLFEDCEVSFKRTVTAMGISIAKIDELDLNTCSDACTKVTLTAGKETFTFRGCSILGEKTCDILNKLPKPRSDITCINCQQCTDKDYCNNANSKVPFASVILMAALSLVLKF
ncbi:uncharacterized protein LOC132194286 [Neocloeon triangulifer]|uniref:uncharacterized protein LOC132194286 n=1 Tax=Neocloeon triangulifer TaxID=2078957 RepID=UPI00286F4E0F|nr:uncharacterized protein LOC132194286 [Neocloeon triangulifer]